MSHTMWILRNAEFSLFTFHIPLVLSHYFFKVIFLKFSDFLYWRGRDVTDLIIKNWNQTSLTWGKGQKLVRCIGRSYKEAICLLWRYLKKMWFDRSNLTENCSSNPNLPLRGLWLPYPINWVQSRGREIMAVFSKRIDWHKQLEMSFKLWPNFNGVINNLVLHCSE